MCFPSEGSCGNIESSFSNLAEFFPPKKQSFSRWTSELDTKNAYFSKRHKLFLGTRRMRFWQHGRNIFKNWPKNFSSKSEIDKKTMTLSEKILFSNWCRGHVKCSFDRLAKFFWQKAEKFYLSVHNCWKKWKFFPGIFLPLNVRVEL